MFEKRSQITKPVSFTLGEMKVANVVMADIQAGTYTLSTSRVGRFLDKKRAQHIEREHKEVLTQITSLEGTLISFIVNLNIRPSTQRFMYSACEAAIEHYGRDSELGSQESLNVLRGLAYALSQK